TAIGERGRRRLAVAPAGATLLRCSRRMRRAGFAGPRSPLAGRGLRCRAGHAPKVLSLARNDDGPRRGVARFLRALCVDVAWTGTGEACRFLRGQLPGGGPEGPAARKLAS